MNYNPINQHINNPEQYAADLWYDHLTFEQQQFLTNHYQVPVGGSPFARLKAYQDRDNTHKMLDWPANVFRAI